jgi:hypothetical protein
MWRRTKRGKRWRRALATALLACLTALPAFAGSFETLLARVDEGLKTNPSGVPEHNLKACRSMRDMAVKLYSMGRPTRAERRLKMCVKLLDLRR